MKKHDFYYELPEELIAQSPLARREQSRMLCMDRLTGETSHRRFFDLPGALRKGDCLVLNDSRVIPARLLGRKDTGGAVEVVLLREAGKERLDGIDGAARVDSGGAKAGKEADPAPMWECLVRPGRRIKPGAKLIFGDGELTAAVAAELDGGNRLIRFDCKGVFLEALERLGKMPLPPYIHEELEDNERYQTVYSKVDGSAAAPTAGLHFTERMMEEISARGIEICYITLHVGLGTFRPVKTDDIEQHRMHAEYFIIPPETAAAVNRAKAGGGKVIAVGTTSCRALESCADETGMISAFSGDTGIFIYPGYKFKCIDGLITNFHLPESTLIMLVSAFAGRENILGAYNEAIRERYRFFSFGDCMFIKPHNC